jgi:hypothetical protein
MSLPTILAHGRAAANNRMMDACTVRRTTGVVTDDLTGAVTPAKVVVYTGPCRIKMAGDGSPTEGGEVTVAVLSMEVHLPIVGSETVQHLDEVTIDAALNDTALVGRTLRVGSKQIRSEATARRIPVEEID